MRHHCGAEVYQTAQHGLYDVDGYRHHYCGAQPLPELERETWDTCEACGGLWVRFGDGPRLDVVTRQPHICPAPKPTPTDAVRTPSTNGHVSVEPPLSRPWRVIP